MGVAGAQPWSTLSQVDAGSWHSRNHAGEPIPTLDHIAAFCQHNSLFLNIEIKPSPDTDRLTGEKVANAAARLWQGHTVPPLLTSFSVAALEGAQDAQPSLPRGLLLDALWEGWLETALRLGCIAIVCNHTLWTTDTVARVHAAGLRTSSYTVNDTESVQRLVALGTDAIITDRIDLFAPAR
jgi:glycerophosphoryl diester phosphodiesterase